MTSVGVLKALGFRPGQALAAVVVPYALVGLVAGLAGVAAGIALTPTMSGILAAQSGLSWNPAPSAGYAALTLAVIGGAVGLAVVLAAHRVRSVPVTTALRGGAGAHSFRHNWLPLDRHPGSPTVVLGLKSMLQNAPQSLMIVVVVALAAASMSFSVGLRSNLFGDRATFVGILVGDAEDVGLSAPSAAQVPALLGALDADPAVRRADVVTARPMTSDRHSLSVNGRGTYAHVPPHRIVTGREPTHPNEVALGVRAAQALGKAVGDQATLSLGGRSATYLVTGLFQSTQYLGMAADLTLDGMRRVEPGLAPTYVAVWLTSTAPADRAAFLERTRRTHPTLVAGASDQLAALDSELGSYADLAATLAAVVLLVTSVVVVIILGLTVRTQLARRQRDDAIQLAFGTTFGALRRQSLVALLPPVLVGAALGAGGAATVVDPLLSALLSSIGIARVSIRLDALGAASLAVAIGVLTAAVVWAATRRVHRLSPVELMAD
jgi:putative ABC transport system permease protein